MSVAAFALRQAFMAAGQPRDDHGRWTKGGGWGGKPEGFAKLEGVPPARVEAIRSTLTRLGEEFPEAYAKMPSIYLTDELGSAGNHPTLAKHYISDSRVVLNRDAWTLKEGELESYLAKNHEVKWLARSDPEGIIAHEFGHNVHNRMQRAVFEYKGDDKALQNEAAAMRIRAQDLAKGQRLAQVSGYAKAGGNDEAFAEAFSLLYSGKGTPAAIAAAHPSKYVKKVHELTEDYKDLARRIA